MSPAKKPRKELRLLVSLPVQVQGAGRRFTASGRDLTFSGMRLRYPQGHLLEGDRLEVTMTLPSGAFTVPAQVAWTEPDPPEEMAGLQFLHTKESRQRLDDLLVTLESRGTALRRITPTVKWRPMK
jgi:hypothetical protein